MSGRGRAWAAACSTVALTLAGFGAQAVVLNGSAVAAPVTDFYVSATSGSDSNDGSPAHPWKTIAFAADQDLAAGTTVHVADGTYTDPVDNDNNGTASAYITFAADHAGRALIDLSADHDANDFPFENEGNYVRITGFEVTGPTAKQGIHLSGSHNVVDHNDVHGIRRHVTCTSSSAANGDGLGDDSETSGNAFVANTVHDVGPDGECQYTHGIYPSGGGDLMQNNIAYDNAGSGLRFNSNLVGATISNNLVFANRQHGISISGDDDSDETAAGFVITNNIIVDNGSSGIYVNANADSDDNEYGHNLFHGNDGADFTNSDRDNWTPDNAEGEVDDDPGLVDYQADGSGDYHPTADSPCVNAGTAKGAPGTDFDGVLRPQGDGYDIGPYEYVSGGGSGGGPGGGSGGGGVTVGFEDGTADHWSGFYGNANPVVTSDVAYEGTHALRFSLSATGHSAVGTSTGLGAVRAGSTVTYHVYAAQSATTVTPFVRDKSYAATMAGSVVLPKGQWATVTWTVPSVSGVGAIGLDASSGSGTVTIDALTWPTS
ncbi:choice-of-anchor Q domain-containing protein [Streptomyces sp. 7R007]